jgi:hypothetical protein
VANDLCRDTHHRCRLTPELSRAAKRRRLGRIVSRLAVHFRPPAKLRL